jgi:hypothetical protein
LRGFWRGTPITHTFQVLLEPDSDPPIAVDATFLQEPRIPKWVPKALLALLAILAVLVALWFALFRPMIRDQATKAANAAVTPKLAAAQQQIGAIARRVGVPVPTPLVSASATPPSTSTAAGPYGNPFSFRVAASSGSPSPSFSFASHQLFSLTDLVLENPNGDSGTLTILRSGTVLFTTNLQNFRDLDYHFVAPVQFNPHTQFQMQVSCANPGGSPCTPSALVAGFMRAPSSH